jgi:hypothetical protein
VTETTSAWIVRVEFDDGETRYYRRVNMDGSEEFTVRRDDAQSFKSERDAWARAHRLSVRYGRIRTVAVEPEI